MARAFGSYPTGRWFESTRRYQTEKGPRIARSFFCLVPGECQSNRSEATVRRATRAAKPIGGAYRKMSQVSAQRRGRSLNRRYFPYPRAANKEKTVLALRVFSLSAASGKRTGAKRLFAERPERRSRADKIRSDIINRRQQEPVPRGRPTART